MRGRTVVLALALVSSGGPVMAEEPTLVASCPESGAGLAAVAEGIARHRVAAGDTEAVTRALRAAGEPHVWPRAMALEASSLDPRDAKARVERWLAEFHHRGRLRCAIASARASGRDTVAAVAVDAQADLEPMAAVARPSSWIDVDARVLVPASKAKVVVLGPVGAPRAVPTSFVDGRVKARANVDQPGAWLFQVVIDGSSGPRPVLEVLVYAGAPPTRDRVEPPAPGEDAEGAGSETATVAEMIARARATELLPPLRPDTALDRVARAHAESMRRAGELAHDVGAGDVRERLANVGIGAGEVGENVAHAATLALAHRALWSSPSHRGNMLGTRFARLGVGVSHDADGSVWVTELFTTAR